jgi:NADPH:quinone reductase-like Zn-dependent oxidoreductase
LSHEPSLSLSGVQQRVRGERVLVTGGTKGVGQAIVQRFQLAGVRDPHIVEQRFDSVVAHAFDLDDGIARIYFW